MSTLGLRQMCNFGRLMVFFPVSQVLKVRVYVLSFNTRGEVHRISAYGS